MHFVFLKGGKGSLLLYWVMKGVCFFDVTI